MKDLIGRKVKGFKFKDSKYNGLIYSSLMNKHIGEVGEITKKLEDVNTYIVQFKDQYWYYPAELIEAHLVDEWVIGEEYEFYFGDGIWRKSELLAVLPECFKYRYVCRYSEDDTINCPHIRHIEPNQEILDQIEVLEKELQILKSKIK